MHCNVCVKHEKSPVTHGIGMQLTPHWRHTGAYLNLTNYLEAILNVILIFKQKLRLQGETFPSTSSIEKILSRIYSIYQIKKKKSHFQNTYFMCHIFTRKFIHNTSWILHQNSAKQVSISQVGSCHLVQLICPNPYTL